MKFGAFLKNAYARMPEIKIRATLKNIYSHLPGIPQVVYVYVSPRVLFSFIRIGSGAILIKSANLFDIFPNGTRVETNTAFFLRAYGCYQIMYGYLGLLRHGITYVVAANEADRNKALINPATILNKSRKKRELRNTERQQKTLVPVDAETQRAIVAYKTDQILQIAKSSLDLVTSLLAFQRLLESLSVQIEQGTLFALSWPEGVTPVRVNPYMDFINVPIANSFLLISVGLNGAYNALKLLKLSYGYTEARENLILNGATGFVNANSYISVTAKIFKSFKKPQSELRIPPGTPLHLIDTLIKEFSENYERDSAEYLKHSGTLNAVWFVNNVAGFQIYQSLGQMGYNAFELWWESLEAELEQLELPTQPEKPEPAKRALLHAFKAYEPLPMPLHVKPPKSDSKPKSDDADARPEGPTLPKRSESQGASAATPRVGNILPTPSAAAPVQNLDWISHKPFEDKVRTENLARINDLRRKNHASDKAINALFNALLHHLSFDESEGRTIVRRAAYIDKSSGSGGRSLVFFYRDARGQLKMNSRLKFEDHGAWQGPYLRKALNVIEAGFLFGWRKEKYDQHLLTRRKQTKLEKILQVITHEKPRQRFL